MEKDILQPKYGGGYDIPRTICNLYKISNLAKNTRYNLSFNDLLTIFRTDENGDLFFNMKKDPLPMQCLSNVSTILSKVDGETNSDPIGGPIAYYSRNICDCYPSIYLNLDGKGEVKFVISNGAIGPRFTDNSIEYYNENTFSGVGIL